MVDDSLDLQIVDDEVISVQLLDGLKRALYDQCIFTLTDKVLSRKVTFQYIVFKENYLW